MCCRLTSPAMICPQCKSMMRSETGADCMQKSNSQVYQSGGMVADSQSSTCIGLFSLKGLRRKGHSNVCLSERATALDRVLHSTCQSGHDLASVVCQIPEDVENWIEQAWEPFSMVLRSGVGVADHRGRKLLLMST